MRNSQRVKKDGSFTNKNGKLTLTSRFHFSFVFTDCANYESAALTS